jgi:hypothetical protein
MYKKLLLIAFIATLSSCSKEDTLTACDGDCQAYLEFPGELDENGYYHVKLDWNREYYPYFAIEAFATPVIPQLRYNEESVVIAQFDTDTYWVMGEETTYKVNLYNPFTSDRTSSGNMIPTSVSEVTVNYFKGTKVFVVQDTDLYFSSTRGRDNLYTKRIVGPFPPYMQNDTIRIDGEVYWEAGNYSTFKQVTAKFIIE